MEITWCKYCIGEVQAYQIIRSKGRNRGRRVVLQCRRCHRNLGRPRVVDWEAARRNTSSGKYDLV